MQWLGSAHYSDESKNMDFSEYVWGVIKYIFPAILFIISVAVTPNFILMMISLIWLFSSIIIYALSLEPENKPRY
jgi:hypothetical protein